MAANQPERKSLAFDVPINHHPARDKFPVIQGPLLKMQDLPPDEIFFKSKLVSQCLSGLEAVCLAVCVCGRVFKLFGEVWVAVGVGVGLPQLQYQREAHSGLPLLLESVAAWFWSRLLCPPQSAPLLPVTGQRHRGTALRSAQCCAALQRRRQAELRAKVPPPTN